MPDDITCGRLIQDVVLVELRYLRRDVAEVKSAIGKLDDRFVTKPEFQPVRAVVYGLVGIILAGAGTAVAAMLYRVPILR